MEERAFIEKYVAEILHIFLGIDGKNFMIFIFPSYLQIIVYNLQVLFIFTLYNSLDHNEQLKVRQVSFIYMCMMLLHTGSLALKLQFYSWERVVQKRQQNGFDPYRMLQ